MSSPNDSLLTDEERAELEERADRFHDALDKGGVDSWDPFIADLSPRVLVQVLVELTILDLGHVWKSGGTCKIEDYLTRFPQLGSLSTIPLKVIVEEYRCRKQAGEKLDEAEVRRRFPNRSAEILSALNKAQETAYYKPTTNASDSTSTSKRRSNAELPVSHQYELIRELGRGVFGEVWLARKNPSGIEKAVKIVTAPADREEAQRELRALELIKNLRHPYLLATEDFWVANNRLHVVMELADGTIKNLLKKCKDQGHQGIPEGQLISYIRESAEGLDYLHLCKITHRDIKPDNILILNGHAKVADFGLARQQDRVMASMSFAGTPLYMAPEIWSGEGGPASDQYSLACVYVELRQGTPALKPKPMAEMMFDILEGQFLLADFITPAERAVLRKAMAKTPGDRYPTCTAFAEELAEALGFQVYRRSAQGSSAAFTTAVQGNEVVLRSISTTEELPSQVIARAKTAATETPKASRTIPNTLARTTTPSQSVALKTRLRPKKTNVKPLIAGGLLLMLLVAIGVLILSSGGATPNTATTDPTSTTRPVASTGGTTPPPTTGTGTGTPRHPISDVRLPPMAVRADDAKIIELADGKLYDWITIDAGGQPVRFRLIIDSGANPLPPFYIMESKVWVKLYRAAALEKGLPGTLHTRSDLNEDEPATGMTALEAQQFAVKVFQGALPTPAEWDLAAGLPESGVRKSPCLEGATVRVNAKTPGPTHSPTPGGDISPLGLRDLCGNGREFTEQLFAAPGSLTRKLTSDTPPRDLVILRGRNYTLERPLDFSILRYEQNMPQTQFAEARSPYTGFRVVIRIAK